MNEFLFQILITDAPNKQSRFEDLYRKILSPSKLIFLRDEVGHHYIFLLVVKNLPLVLPLVHVFNWDLNFQSCSFTLATPSLQA